MTEKQKILGRLPAVARMAYRAREKAQFEREVLIMKLQGNERDLAAMNELLAPYEDEIARASAELAKLQEDAKNEPPPAA